MWYAVEIIGTWRINETIIVLLKLAEEVGSLKLRFTQNSNMNTDNWSLKLVIFKATLLPFENDGGHY